MPGQFEPTPPGGAGVLLLGIGDTHGDFAPLFEAARREPEARALLQVGDLTAGKAGRENHPDDDPATLASLPLPLVWVHGNHEHWDALGLWHDDPPADEAGGAGKAARTGGAATMKRAAAAGTPGRLDTAHGTARATRTGSVGAGRAAGAVGAREAGAASQAGADTAGVVSPFLEHHLWPGEMYVVPGTKIQVVGLPGNHAPTWFQRDKPFPGDRVRHFNAADVAALDRFHQPSVLLMHEAFRRQAPGRIGAMGVGVLEDLVRRLRPHVCLTGHHHTLAVSERYGTRAIALPRAQEGYMRLWFMPAGRLLHWEFVRLREPLPETD